MPIFPVSYPGIPPIFLFGLSTPQEQIILAYDRFCDSFNFKDCFSEEMVLELSENLIGMDEKLRNGESHFHTLLKRENGNYNEYLADITLFRKIWDSRSHSYEQADVWPSVMLFYKFDTGFEGQIHIRRKSTFLSYFSEGNLGLEKAKLENPLSGFEKRIFVTTSKYSPLQTLINADTQTFLLNHYGEYPFKLMDNPLDGIYMGKTGILFFVRRTLEENKINQLLMFGEKFTSLIRGLLDMEN